MKVYRFTLWAQGLYSLFTGLWGLIDIDSFMVVTGPKNDIWLVKTVSVLIIAISITLLLQLFIPSNPFPIIILGLLTAAGLGTIDFYYSARRIISPVYAYDGIIEAVFVLIWLLLLINIKKLKQ